MDALNQAIAQISDVLWNSVLLFLLEFISLFGPALYR